MSIYSFLGPLISEYIGVGGLVDSPLLTTINNLAQSVRITVGCYVHTLNSGVGLENIGCLDAIDVCMLHTLHPNYHGIHSVPHTYDGDVVQEVKEIMSRNAKLTSLHLALRGSYGMLTHDRYKEVRLRTLEVIGPALWQLQNLTLEGDLVFGQQSWPHWIRIFQGLNSLSLIGMSLIQSVTSCAQVSFPRLRSLQLHAYPKPYEMMNSASYRGDFDSISAVLSKLSLDRLFLCGFDPRPLLRAIPSGDNQITDLYVYVNDDVDALEMQFETGQISKSQSAIESLLLSHADFERLRYAWPKLQDLTVDVIENHIPVADESLSNPDTTPDQGTAGSNPSSSSAQSISIDLLPIDISILTTLAGMHLLRRLSLNIKTRQSEIARVRASARRQQFRVLETFETGDVFATYRFLCCKKAGSRFDKVMFRSGRDRFVRWEIWEQGPDFAVVRIYESGGISEEVWNMRTGKLEEGRQSIREQRGQIGSKAPNPPVSYPEA